MKEAAVLAETIGRMLHERFDGHSVVSSASTGAGIAEVALKQAEFHSVGKTGGLLKEVE
jgi:hypothetical protein